MLQPVIIAAILCSFMGLIISLWTGAGLDNSLRGALTFLGLFSVIISLTAIYHKWKSKND